VPLQGINSRAPGLFSKYDLPSCQNWSFLRFLLSVRWIVRPCHPIDSEIVREGIFRSLPGDDFVLPSNSECIREFTPQVGQGIFRTKVDSQWNRVYHASHRICCIQNERIRRLRCKRDLDAAHIRSALVNWHVQVCGKETPSASILFSHENSPYVSHTKM